MSGEVGVGTIFMGVSGRGLLRRVVVGGVGMLGGIGESGCCLLWIFSWGI